MTTLTHNDIINSVLRLMDEHGGNAAFMSGSAMDETKRVIEQVTENAIRKMHLQAPVAMLDAVIVPAPQILEWKQVNGRHVPTLLLPDGFFRLISCKMDSWKRPVSQLWWEDSAEYAKQKNRYLMNTWERPAAFYVHRGINKCVELYSCPTIINPVVTFEYAPTPTWDNNHIDVADRLKDASLMQIATDTLVVLGEGERAQQMQALAMQAINTYGGMERHFSDNGNRVER